MTYNPHLSREFTSRLRPGRPHHQHCVELISGFDQMAVALGKASDKLKSDPMNTDFAVRHKLANTVKEQYMRDFAYLNAKPRKALARMKVERDGLGLRPLNRADHTGEMRRAEIRAYVRSLSAADRNVALADPAVSEAVFDGLPGLSGLHPEQFRAMRGEKIRELHGPKLEEIEAVESDYGNVAGMASAVRQSLLAASGLGEKEFEAEMSRLEAETDK